MEMRTNWRSDLEWSKEGLPVGTVSPDAAKLYDAALSQYVSWRDDPNMGGLDSTLEKMLASDPNFALGKALKVGLDLIGTGKTIRLDAGLREEVSDLERISMKDEDMDPRHRLHLDAVIELSKNNIQEANDIYEQILTRWPTDMHALKFAHDGYFYLGKKREMRDSIARVYPSWSEKSLPLKEYIYGMFAFGLEENCMYPQAEREALKGLTVNPYDGWATHALAHVMEMEGRYDEGINYMEQNQTRWITANYLAVHNVWHLGLYKIEMGDFEGAQNLFDHFMGPRTSESGSMLDVVDSSSFLHRLRIACPSLSLLPRWRKVLPTVRQHLTDHILAFNDIHFMMTCLGAEDSESIKKLRDSFKADKNEFNTCGGHVLESLFDAFIAFYENRYETVVEKLYPIRYDIVSIGGSDAQRDIFDQTLILSAIKSEKEHHQMLAQQLLAERKTLRPQSTVIQRSVVSTQ